MQTESENTCDKQGDWLEIDTDYKTRREHTFISTDVGTHRPLFSTHRVFI